jgi:hypothetical protein
MIFLEGAPTDLIYWMSSGLVDILCPEPDGNQAQASLLEHSGGVLSQDTP